MIVVLLLLVTVVSLPLLLSSPSSLSLSTFFRSCPFYLCPSPPLPSLLFLTRQDTAGEERYASLSSFYCRGADVAILSFDLTDRKSLSRLQEVFIPLLHDSVRSCLTVVVGTKLDLASSGGRQVKSSDGRRLAEEQHRQMSEKAMARDPNSYLVNVSAKKLYFETSAKSGDGISEIFEFIQSVVVPELEKQGGGEARKKNRSITLGESDAMRGGPKCCHKS